MRVLAQRGDGAVLVDLQDGAERGVVVMDGRVFPAMDIHAILARGLWGDVRMSGRRQEVILAEVKEQGLTDDSDAQ